jgi:hypothetical protein
MLKLAFQLQLIKIQNQKQADKSAKFEIELHQKDRDLLERIKASLPFFQDLYRSPTFSFLLYKKMVGDPLALTPPIFPLTRAARGKGKSSPLLRRKRGGGFPFRGSCGVCRGGGGLE